MAMTSDFMARSLNLAFLCDKLYLEEEAIAVFRGIRAGDPGHVIAAEGMDQPTRGKDMVQS